jgi:N-acetylneuraminic acid mutarotase
LTPAVLLSAIGVFNGAVQAQPSEPDFTWRVDDDAPDGGDGLSWPSAFNTLQAALEQAALPGSDLIKVAQGTYRPSVPSTPPEAATFRIDFFDVTIEGGYAGIGQPDPDLRDIEAFETILNGALPPDDPPPHNCGGPDTIDCSEPNPGVPGCDDPGCCDAICSDPSFEYCCWVWWDEVCAVLAWDMCPIGVYHVVTIENVDDTVRLDGLTITGGSAVGAGAADGGGVLVRDAEPVIVACRFKRNRASGQGGALHLASDTLLLVEPLVVNCAFLRNRADLGGAVSAVGVPQSIEDPARVMAPLFVNCVFSGNRAGDGAGIFAGAEGKVKVVNCTVNSNDYGGVFVDAGQIGGNGAAYVNNSILWANGSYQISYPAQVIVNYSDVQGGFSGLGEGNTNVDPDFVDELGLDMLPGTDDDNLRLELDSPLVDAGKTARVPPDTADLDGDGDVRERTPFDVAFVQRIGLGQASAPSICTRTVDMGAFESSDCQPDGTPDEQQLIGNDENGDGIPDLPCQDCDGDGTPDFLEIKQQATEDCNLNGVPDECEVDPAHECSVDADGDDVPDECQMIWQLRAPFRDPRVEGPPEESKGVEGAAASLIDGKIYVSHGNRGEGHNDRKFLSIYDFASDSWTHGGPSAPDASVPRSELAGGTAMGKHYAIGGRTLGSPNVVRDTLEEFYPDPVPAWTTRASMDVQRAGLGAASWGNEIHAIGGRTGASFGSLLILDTHEVYDPNSDAWTERPALPNAVSDNYATLAHDGKIYVFGGATSPFSVTTAVQIYDIATGQWDSGPPMPTPRAAAMAGVVDGLIAVFGGYDPDPSFATNVAVTELYDPVANRWWPGRRMFHPASEMAQGVTWDASGIYAVGSGIFGESSEYLQRLVPRSACLADIDGDCQVGITDFLLLLAAWGPCPEPPEPCLADFDGDGEVGITDFMYLLATWGPCPDCEGAGAAQSLQAAFQAIGLVWPADLETFIDCMTNGTQAEQQNCLCWMMHYLEGCQGLFCIPPDCPGQDPFSNPPINHLF